MNSIPRPIPAKGLEIEIDGVLRRVVFGQHPPGASGSRQVEQPIEDVSHVDGSWPSAGLGGLDQSRNRLPLFVTQIAWIIGIHAKDSSWKERSHGSQRAKELPQRLQPNKTFSNTF